MAKSNAEKADALEANFTEIHPPMNAGEAAIEANRCLYCYDAPCIQACPTHIEVPRYIKAIGSKDFAGAARTILEANPMGHSCARVCPVEVLCEGACVYVKWHEKPIEIARLQRAATDAFYYGKAKAGFRPGPKNGMKVGVIGAGPAGLSCAFYLARLGYAVTIFDRKTEPGGLNTYGIAEYKMTQKTALDEVKLVRSLGVQFRCGVEVGDDVPLETLEKEFDAVFVGIGLGATSRLGVPGEDLDGVWEALTFIERVKTRRFADIPVGRTVVVIGAGNTAVDAVTQAKRLGAQRVLMAYRRGREQASAYGYEIELAKQDAVEFLWNAAPVEILGKGAVQALRMVRTRQTPKGLELVPGSEFLIECDRVIKAIGQTKQVHFLEQVSGLTLTPKGTIVVNADTLETTRPRWFAGGDAVNGGKEVVNAAADGKRAAWAIHRKLSGVTKAPPEHAYWVSTIEGRKIAPMPARTPAAPAPKKAARKTRVHAHG